MPLKVVLLKDIFFQEGEDVNIGDTLGVIDPTR